MKPSPRNVTAFSLGHVLQHILHLRTGPCSTGSPEEEGGWPTGQRQSMTAGDMGQLWGFQHSVPCGIPTDAVVLHLPAWEQPCEGKVPYLQAPKCSQTSTLH